MEVLTLGKKLSSLRGHYRKTQKQVAHEIGITQEQLSDFENDKKTPNHAKLNLLAKAYYTTIEGILNYEPNQLFNNTFNDHSKGFFNVQKVILSNIEEVIADVISEKKMAKGKELKITMSFKIE